MMSCYRGVMHAYTSIARQEGVVGGLWRGTGANVTRNAIVNVGETVVYDAAKDALLTGGYMRWGQKYFHSNEITKRKLHLKF